MKPADVYGDERVVYRFSQFMKLWLISAAFALLGGSALASSADPARRECVAGLLGAVAHADPVVDVLEIASHFKLSQFEGWELPNGYFDSTWMLKYARYRLELEYARGKLAAQAELSAQTVFNPLSGSDFVTSSTLFPGARTYVLSGMESFYDGDAPIDWGEAVGSNYMQRDDLPDEAGPAILAGVLAQSATARVRWIARFQIPGSDGRHGMVAYRDGGQDKLVIYLNLVLRAPRVAGSAENHLRAMLAGAPAPELVPELWWLKLVERLHPDAWILKATQGVFNPGADAGVKYSFERGLADYWSAMMREWLCRYRPQLVSPYSESRSRGMTEELAPELSEQGELVASVPFLLGFGYGENHGIGVRSFAKARCSR